jgi:uncharacterized membrane protein HdeD (DUF308 family)
MPVPLIRNWWSLIIRGLVATLFGLITFAWPGITLSVLVLLFGVYAIVDGIMSLAGVFRASRANERWGALLLEGIAGIVAGLVTFAWPAITTLALVVVIASWAIVTGVFEIVAAIRLRKYITNEWLLVLSGVLSLLLGVLFIAAPLAGALAIAPVIFGGLMMGLGLRLRGYSHPFDARTAPSPV